MKIGRLLHKFSAQMPIFGRIRSKTAKLTPVLGITQRRQLELNQTGLGRTPDANEFDVAAKNQAAIDQAKADKIERQAQTDVHVAIDKVLFTNMRGVDNRQTDDLRAELRAYVRDAGNKKWSAVLAHVTSRIAAAYRIHERQQEQFNSR